MQTITSDQLFEIKSKFLSTIPHPKLILKQINRLSDANYVPQLIISEQQINLIDYLQGYIDQLMPLKLQISQASLPGDLRVHLISLYQLQLELIHKLAYYLDDAQDLKRFGIRQSEPFDAYAAWKELKELCLDENQIKGYLCKQISEGESDSFSTLVKDAIRAQIILQNE